MSRQEQVPYVDGLTEGQGFNTYNQSGCVHDAVRIQRELSSAEAPNDVEITYHADEISDYTKFVQSLDISAGAGVSKWGIGGGVDAEFLDRKEFDASFLTYLVKVDVRQQPSTTSKYSFNWIKPTDPNTTYGNRFISDFVKGGALFARVSIITKDTSMHREIREAIAFPVYGVDVKVTEAMKTSIDKIHKHSEVHIYSYSVGAPKSLASPNEQVRTSQPQPDDLLQLKQLADSFLANAKSHQWKRFAILEKYTNISDWKDQFSPLDYSDAEARSWGVFNDFTEYFAIRKTIREIAQEHYTGGRAKRDTLEAHASDVLAGYRQWIAKVSRTPEAAKEKPPYDPPEIFRTEALLAVERTRYIAQSLHLKDGRRTHVIDDRLREHAKRLFEVEAYGFDDVTGSSVLLFAKKIGEDKYTCLSGRSVTPGYEELSHLWVSETRILGVLDQKVDVVAVPEVGCIELELQGGSHKDSDVLFSFYVRKV